MSEGPTGMPAIGICMICKKKVEVTKHHDRNLNKVIVICRSCHDVLEWYRQLSEDIKQKKLE